VIEAGTRLIGQMGDGRAGEMRSIRIVTKVCARRKPNMQRATASLEYS